MAVRNVSFLLRFRCADSWDRMHADGPRCYAAGLGDCYGKVNREHYISQSALKQIGDGKSVTVRNVPFLKKDTPKESGLRV